MIINVRGCSNKTGIIVSYLVENEENTGYDSFNAKKIIVKNKIDILAAIKKTLISSRKLPEISASDFVSTINGVGKKNTVDTSLKTIVKSVNDENMQSTMLTLSHVYFNNKPLSQVKAINIINGNMYFMVKMGSNYNLEPIKSEKIKCVIVISSLVNLYRRVKQGGLPPKNSFKKHYIQSRPMPAGTIRGTSGTIRGTYRNSTYHGFGEVIVDSSNRCCPAEPVSEERLTNPPRTAVREITSPTISPSDNGWCSPTVYAYSEDAVIGETNRQVPEDLANIDIPTTERQRTEQRERTVESVCEENIEVPQPEILETNEEERPIVIDNFTITERPLRLEEIERLTNVETTMETEVTETNEEERPVGIDLAAAEERYTSLETQNSPCESRRETEISNRNRYGESQREAEVAVSVAEVVAENAPIPPLLAERPRQIVERNRRSFVEYLRENQTATFNTVRENDSTSC